MANDPETGERIADIVPVYQSDVSYEVELDERPEPGPPVLVDPRPVVELRPIIPPHLRTWPGVRAAAARQAGRHWRRARYHAIRSPRYLLLTALWAVAGLVKLIGRQLHRWRNLSSTSCGSWPPPGTRASG
jgi:S-DNA-T family DNA segregation ATPase FtsK/SpoIIIE